MSQTDGYREIRLDFNFSYDPCDAWASVMGWLFGVADTLWHFDPDLIPDAWQYGHSPVCHGDSTDYPDCDIQDGLDDGRYTPEDLVAFGSVLDRWSDMIRANGKDY